jgi:hypothetical protein
LAFGNCSFDETSTDAFETMFAQNSNLCGLGLASTVSFTKPTQIMVARILQNHSPLQMLAIEVTGNPEGGIMMLSIMKALESNTTLHYLGIEGVDDHVCAALGTGLPKLRGLHELRCDGFHLAEMQQSMMLEAFKRNISIQKTSDVEEAFPDDDDKKKLRFYAMRNKNIPLLLDNPDRVPLSAWPKIFEITQQTEFHSTIIFNALQKVACRICQENPRRKRRLSDLEHESQTAIPH